jgi:ubiquinone/menaquinone biosynthesis C-methylase UbiE
MLTPPKVRKIPAPLLKRFSDGCYVDSPVYFDAPAWVRWMNWAKLDRLFRMVPPGAPLHVLDFACGNGVLFPTWEAYGQMTVGIDLHVTAANRVCRHYQLKKVFLTKAGGALLPFRNESYDLVFAASVLEHFSDLKPPLEEVRRVLRNGGQMLFLCPNENHFYDWGRRIAGYEKPPDHYHTANEVISQVGDFFSLLEVVPYPGRVPSALAVYKLGRALKM